MRGEVIITALCGDHHHHHHRPPGPHPESDHLCHYRGPRASTLLAEQSFDLFDVFSLMPNLGIMLRVTKYSFHGKHLT